MSREHSITQDYEREFPQPEAPLQLAVGKAELRGRQSIKAVDLESEVRWCAAIRTSGPSSKGLGHRPWGRQNLWHQLSLLHGQEQESDEEWQHLIEATEPLAMQLSTPLSLLRDPAFRHRVQARLAESAQQVSDGWSS